jgi:hypothetical protein
MRPRAFSAEPGSATAACGGGRRHAPRQPDRPLAQRADPFGDPFGDLGHRHRVARLADDVDGAHAQCLDSRRRARLGERADDDGRNRVVLPELPQEAQAVHARHLDVERDDIGLVLQDHLPRLAGVSGATHDLEVVVRAQGIAQQLPRDEGVIHDDNAGAGGQRHVSAGCAPGAG